MQSKLLKITKVTQLYIYYYLSYLCVEGKCTDCRLDTTLE